ncbi:MAG: PAS domain-containing protein [Peptococcaceae bacterium]|nr:PAS domain-containing protein [Peptococcaceae bacterium]
MFPIINNMGNCRDCYRCLRVCDVKAISFRGGQAKIMTDQCVLCGRCVRECPQYTKSIIDQTAKLEEYLKQYKVVLSLPPTFINHFHQWSQAELWARLKHIGFYAVEEMAVNAEPFLNAYTTLLAASDDYIISSHCPIIVNLIEQKFPKLLPHLAPIENEAVIHARLLKQKYGSDTKVVHVSPCLSMVGKENDIDLTITLDQAMHFIFGHKVNKETLDAIEPELTQYQPIGAPLAIAGNLAQHLIDRDVLHRDDVQALSGISTCLEALRELEKATSSNVRFSRFIELNGCRDGCVSGFGLEKRGILEKEMEIHQYCQQYSDKPVYHFEEVPDISHTFQNRYVEPAKVDTKQIREILSNLKQYNKKVMNCGACGYDTCYEKALAVARGHAEEKMCQTYMRGRAESTANTAIASSPSGIIIFDQDFIIQDFNPAAREMFSKYGLKVGNAVFEYIDHRHFEKVAETGWGIKNLTVRYDDLGIVTRQNIVRMQGTQDLYMATITDITEEETKRAALDKIREETLTKATQVINNQMFVAQQIAGLLGETTADTKIILLDLIQQFHQEKELEP